ncbi:MAG TPA: hypothetical protein DD620_01785 [Verrucomicrobia bacterium]|nr:hypothetical protein [Verrucomicrobiota bacterium]|tara:strand:+ start:2819 stop:3739 length:921 start_codon:yes stop_codon:yes gene_type:complete
MIDLCPSALVSKKIMKSFPSIKLLILPFLITNAFGQSFLFTDSLHEGSDTYIWTDFSRDIAGPHYLPQYFNTNAFPIDDGNLPYLESSNPSPFNQTSDSLRLYGGHDTLGTQLFIKNISSDDKIDHLSFQILYTGYSLTNNTMPSIGVQSNNVSSVIYDSVYLSSSSVGSNIAPTSINMTYNNPTTVYNPHNGSYSTTYAHVIDFIWDLKILSLYDVEVSWNQKHSSIIQAQISLAEINYNLHLDISNNVCSLSFNTSSGITYTVNACTNLLEGAWFTRAAIMANTTNTTYIDTLDHDIIFWTITE